MPQPIIHLNEDTHTYMDQTGQIYTPVSDVYKSVVSEFPTNIVAGKVAKKRGIPKERVLAEWDKKREDACRVGNIIDKAWDDFFLTGKIPENRRLQKMIKNNVGYFNHYEDVDPQVLCYDYENKIAGTMDLRCWVSKKKKVISIKDIKSNLSRGIQRYNKYGKYLLEPFSYLEDCNYNHYSFQLNLYAYLMQKTYRYKIGSLEILYVDPWKPERDFKIFHVNYMPREAKRLIKHYRKRYPLKDVQEKSWTLGSNDIF